MMTSPCNDNRAIVYYNGAISALTLFAQYPHGSVLAPEPLPPSSLVLDKGCTINRTVTTHPASIAATINKIFGLPNDLLKVNGDFREQVEIPHGLITVYLLRIDLLDPPHRLMADKGCQLKTLTQLRGQPPVEMELLRRAYALLMES